MFFHNLFSHDKKISEKKMDSLLKDFVRLYDKITVETEKEYQLYEQSKNVFIRERKLDLKKIKENQRHILKLLALAKKYFKIRKDIIVIFNSEHKNFGEYEHVLIKEITISLNQIEVYILEIKKYLKDVLHYFEEVRKHPDQTEEWDDIIDEDFKKLGKDLFIIKFNIHKLWEADKNLEQVEKYKTGSKFIPFLSRQFLNALQTDTHFQDPHVMNKQIEFMKFLTQQGDENLATGKFQDLTVYPKKNSKERVAYFREGNRVFFCEPLYHVTDKTYNNRWIESKKRKADYDGWYISPWWHPKGGSKVLK